MIGMRIYHRQVWNRIAGNGKTADIPLWCLSVIYACETQKQILIN